MTAFTGGGSDAEFVLGALLLLGVITVVIAVVMLNRGGHR